MRPESFASYFQEEPDMFATYECIAAAAPTISYLSRSACCETHSGCCVGGRRDTCQVCRHSQHPARGCCQHLPSLCCPLQLPFPISVSQQQPAVQHSARFERWASHSRSRPGCSRRIGRCGQGWPGEQQQWACRTLWRPFPAAVVLPGRPQPAGLGLA